MKLIKNFLLSLVSIIFFLLFLELVVLKYIIPTTDVARVEHREGITRYIRSQSGVTRLANEYSAPFAINEDGWNSHHKKYSLKRNNKTRIAVIGDSYIAALEPGYKKAMPYLLEQQLGSENFEVYGFGIGAAHLAQYLHMLKKEVLKYTPDIIVFLIIHNDFAPSYKKDLMASGRYGGTFLTYSISPDKKIKEIPPKAYNSSWDRLLNFRLLRFTFYQYKLRTKINSIKSLVLNEQYKMNVNIKDLEAGNQNDAIVADYVVKNISSLAQKNKIKLVFAMNGDTQSIYHPNSNEETNVALELNNTMKQIVEKYGGEFIDLQDTFYDDYKVNQKKFEFKTDGHWSPYGHLVATAPVVRAVKGLTHNNPHSSK
jgi:ribosomal protein L18E